MPENEFEKKVQKQLEDFQLNPSASVWKSVEDQIRKKKRRRVIFYILLPLAISLMGYLTNHFLLTDSKNESGGHRIVEQTVSAKNEKRSASDETNTSVQVKEKSITVQPKEINKPVGLNEKEISQDQNTRLVVKNNRQLVSKDISMPEAKKRSVIKYNTGARLQKKSDDPPVTNNNAPVKGEMVAAIQKPVTETDEKIEMDQHVAEEKKIQKEDIAIAEEKKISKEDITVAEKDPVITKMDSLKTENPMDNKKEVIVKNKTGKFKVNWGIDLSAGLTSNHSNIFSLNKSYAADALYSTPGSSTGGNPPVIIPPSLIRPGPSFKVGIATEMQISKRSRVSTGLQYTYVSNRIKIGIKEDTTVQIQLTSANNFSSTKSIDEIYRGAGQNNYTNRYHFIQIPIWYHWQINKSEKLPIQWNVGAAFSYMFATNGLVYNSGFGGIYYHHKEAFTKTHFNLATGILFRLKSKSRMEWITGPELSFDISPLMKNDNKQYLLYGGLNTRLLFLKKKNK